MVVVAPSLAELEPHLPISAELSPPIPSDWLEPVSSNRYPLLALYRRVGSVVLFPLGHQRRALALRRGLQQFVACDGAAGNVVIPRKQHKRIGRELVAG